MQFSRDAEQLIASLRGLQNPTGMPRNCRPSKPLRHCLERALSGYTLSATPFQTTLLENWPKLLPAHFSKEVRIEKLSTDGTLFLKASAGPLRTELKFISNALLLRIQSLEGGEVVKKIIFR